MEWDERCAAQWLATNASASPACAMRLVHDVLRRTRWVIVESYEWESELD